MTANCTLNNPPLFQFRVLLQQYTSRAVTYEIDIYEAFAGLNEFMKAGIGSEIRFGLVERSVIRFFMIFG